MLIFERSRPGRKNVMQCPAKETPTLDMPATLLRKNSCGLPEVSELQVVRHYTKLSRKNAGIETHFYPLGSCTMKYNPRGIHQAVNQSAITMQHPLTPIENTQSLLAILYDLQTLLAEITGMQGVALSPMAGSQGELAGTMMIKAYHYARGDHQRRVVIVPDCAHGTNPASAKMCGFDVREVPTNDQGEIDLVALADALNPDVAGIMLTNPSTLGVFERDIQTVSAMVHECGGLLYYDGANLNAILGKVRPGDMGFDVVHLNCHKTFATPHGGGGPGAGPVAVGKRLLPYLPIPRVGQKNNVFYWLDEADCPETIGRLSAFMGNTGILLRAYAYLRALGQAGLHRVAEFACLNAQYLMHGLAQQGYQLAFPGRRASHEFIIRLDKEKAQFGVNALDVAKRLADYGFHAPTVYFPISIPECLLIEPTETEDLETLEAFLQAMQAIRQEIQHAPKTLKQAPQTTHCKRLDEIRAARELDVCYAQSAVTITYNNKERSL